ncbi:uncharacterized protein LOC127726080 [Mytilus californianus]|uniref:uncharacterized protein LOC127726080 n=1 Tax=Mytilus californianus TaxID=6549 RepID=UPI0022462580|nr:uncharacterized protein LOC127726080 [Mytilus californianus]
MVSYEVQYGTRRQVATAFIIGSGTETEMIQMKTDRETSQPPGEASTRLPTPPSTEQTGQPTSPPTIRRHAKRKRTTSTTPMRQSKTAAKILYSKVSLSKTTPSTTSESTTRQSASTSRIVPPT